jgi:hypothetical protein
MQKTVNWPRDIDASLVDVLVHINPCSQVVIDRMWERSVQAA